MTIDEFITMLVNAFELTDETDKPNPRIYDERTLKGDGFKIYVEPDHRTSSKSVTLRIYGVDPRFNRFTRHSEPLPRIRVSLTRKPDELIIDIHRRLLQPFYVISQSVTERIKKFELDVKRSEETANLILDLVSGRMKAHQRGEGSEDIRRYVHAWQWQGPVSLDAEIFPDDVDLEIKDLPPLIARAIVELVAESCKGAPTDDDGDDG